MKEAIYIKIKRSPLFVLFGLTYAFAYLFLIKDVKNIFFDGLDKSIWGRSMRIRSAYAAHAMPLAIAESLVYLALGLIIIESCRLFINKTFRTNLESFFKQIKNLKKTRVIKGTQKTI